MLHYSFEIKRVSKYLQNINKNLIIGKDKHENVEVLI